jgi:hypothetical protein
VTRPGPAARPKWTARQVRALGVSTDLRTAGSVFGISPSQSYEAAKAGTFPVPVIKCGTRYVVPVAAILKALCIDTGNAGPIPLHVVQDTGAPGA